MEPRALCVDPSHPQRLLFSDRFRLYSVPGPSHDTLLGPNPKGGGGGLVTAVAVAGASVVSQFAGSSDLDAPSGLAVASDGSFCITVNGTLNTAIQAVNLRTAFVRDVEWADGDARCSSWLYRMYGAVWDLSAAQPDSVLYLTSTITLSRLNLISGMVVLCCAALWWALLAFLAHRLAVACR
jgi:hypothetical protein